MENTRKARELHALRKFPYLYPDSSRRFTFKFLFFSRCLCVDSIERRNYVRDVNVARRAVLELVDNQSAVCIESDCLAAVLRLIAEARTLYSDVVA